MNIALKTSFYYLHANQQVKFYSVLHMWKLVCYKSDAILELQLKKLNKWNLKP